MNVIYLNHDCFLLEFDKCAVLTDYYRGVAVDPLSFSDKNKMLYVVVSHHHKDHFSPRIFSFWHRREKIRYIVSRDVEAHSSHLWNSNSSYKGKYKVDSQLVTVLGLHETYQDSNIRIETFGSTDIGNSYVIESKGFRVFFAGDLNAWTWRSESTTEEAEDMLRQYCDILDDIKSHYRSFDLALFPVDPRMEADATEGARIFCKKFDVRYFVPMHFELWESEEKRDDFRKIAASSGKEIVDSTRCRYEALLRESEKLEIKKQSDFQ